MCQLCRLSQTKFEDPPQNESIKLQNSETVLSVTRGDTGEVVGWEDFMKLLSIKTNEESDALLGEVVQLGDHF